MKKKDTPKNDIILDERVKESFRQKSWDEKLTKDSWMVLKSWLNLFPDLKNDGNRSMCFYLRLCKAEGRPQILSNGY